MDSRYAIIGDEVWDLDIEEPVEQLSSTDAEDAELLALIDDLDDDAFVDAVLHAVVHHVF
jgi:hypothetical protein